MDPNDVNQFIKFLTRQQRGGGLDNDLLYYKSNYNRQRGAGLGSILGSIAKHLIPFAKNILWPTAKKYVLPHAKTAALGFTDDLLEGRNFGQSLKERGTEVIKGATQQLRDQSGSGRRKRSISRPSSSTRKKPKLEFIQPISLNLSKWQPRRT